MCINLFVRKKAIQISYKISLSLHRFFNRNRSFTIISRDCIGGIIYHQYGLKFFSPTINLFLDINDFNFFCVNLKEYIDGTLLEDKQSKESYPVCILIPSNSRLPKIRIYFQHYKNTEEAINKWNERKQRVNWNNIYVINNCTNERDIKDVNKDTILLFNSIKYKKIIFVQRHMGFENEFIVAPPSSGYHHSYIMDNKKHSWKCLFNEANLNRFFKKNNIH